MTTAVAAEGDVRLSVVVVFSVVLPSVSATGVERTSGGLTLYLFR